MNQVARVNHLLEQIEASVMGCNVFYYVMPDPFNKNIAWLQPSAVAQDSINGSIAEFTGRKWLVDGTMTDDEVIRTAYLAYSIYIQHEAMEGFKYKGVSVFTPHNDLDALIALWGK